MEQQQTRVATVGNNGLVTAVSLGTTTITATAGGKSATCTVTVEPIPVGSITLDKTQLSLKHGESETLTATVQPDNATDKSVAWSSDKPDIATVDQNGMVTALSPGLATITATAGEKSATCAVTVDPIPVESIALDKTELTLRRQGSETLTATVQPDDATDKSVVWSSDEPDIATVDDNGTVTAVSPGLATITATAGEKSVTCAVTVEPDVYAVGYVSSDPSFKALLWKNGEATELPMHTPYQVVVSEGDVYVVGSHTNDDGKYAPVVWKNGTITELAGIGSHASSICVSDGNVYVTEGQSGRLWENGVQKKVDEEAISCKAHSVFVSGGDVYVGGARRLSTYNNLVATYWKNGVATELTDGTSNAAVSAIHVAKGVVYAAGYEVIGRGAGGDELQAMLWINGVPTALAEGFDASAVAVSENGDVYVAGYAYGRLGALWKNGELIILNHVNYLTASAYGLSLYGDDVYVSGYEVIGNVLAPVLWKNGVRTELPGNATLAKSVFVY